MSGDPDEFSKLIADKVDSWDIEQWKNLRKLKQKGSKVGNFNLTTFVHGGTTCVRPSWLLICPITLRVSSWWAMSILQLQCAAGYKLVYSTMSRDRCASVIHTCVSSARHDPARKSHPVIIYSKWHTHLSQCFLTHLILQPQICHWVSDLINKHRNTA